MPAAIRFSRSEFARMWADPRQSNVAIARHFGAHPPWVSMTAKRLGLPPRRPGIKVAVDTALFAHLWTAGVRTDDLMQFFGLPRASLAKLADQCGLARRYPGQRCRVRLAAVRDALLRQALAAEAKETLGALACAEMLDNAQAVMRRAA